MRKLKLKELNRVSPSDFKAQEKTPIVLVLDNIRSGLNVGSAFRTSDAFSLEKIYLCGITAQPPHREILKTAIGATNSMDWSYHESTVSAIEELKKNGYCIVAVEQAENSIMLQDFKVKKTEKIALVFGNEVKGTKHSLNISVSTGVVIWDLFKQVRF